MPKLDYYKEGQLTDVSYLILVSLAQPCHGYVIMAKVDEMTAGSVKIGPASLYTSLKKLMDAGFIQMMDDDKVKKVYKLTKEGIKALEVEIEKRENYARYGKEAMDKIQEEKL